MPCFADADGDEGLGAQALDGEGDAAGDVADGAVGLEDPHPLCCYCGEGIRVPARTEERAGGLEVGEEKGERAEMQGV